MADLGHRLPPAPCQALGAQGGAEVTPMIYHIKYLNGTEKTVRADGFDVSWKSVFAFYVMPDGLGSKRTILYAPTSLVLWIEPVSDEADKELIKAELEAAMKTRSDEEA